MINLKKSMIAGVVLASVCSVKAVETAYDIVELGTFEDNEIFALGLNNSNQVTGYSYDVINEPVRGFRYLNGTFTPTGFIQNPEFAFGTLATPVAITWEQSVSLQLNNTGLAVGYSTEAFSSDFRDEDGNLITVTFDEGTPEERDLEFGDTRILAVYFDEATGTANVIPRLDPEQTLEYRALSVNDAGIVVGFANLDVPDDLDLEGNDIFFPVSRGFIYNVQTQELTQVNPINYDNTIRGIVIRDINNNGDAVGWSQVPFGENQVIANGVFFNISDPNSLTAIVTEEETDSQFNAINNNGLAIGRVFNIGIQRYEAVVYNTGNTALETIPALVEGLDAQNSSDNANPLDINAQNEVVGSMITDVVPDTYHAFIYADGTTHDLNDLIDCEVNQTTGVRDWVLYEARQINDNGVIIGNGLFRGERKAFMLTPNPGETPLACPVDEDDDSGSGSFSFGFMAFIGGLIAIRRRAKK